MLYIRELQLFVSRRDFPDLKTVENAFKNYTPKQKITNSLLNNIFYGDIDICVIVFDNKKYLFLNKMLFNEEYNIIGIFANLNPFISSSLSIGLNNQWFFSDKLPHKLFLKFQNVYLYINYVSHNFFYNCLNKEVNIRDLVEKDKTELLESFINGYLPTTIKNLSVSEEGEITFEPITIDLTQDSLEQEIRDVQEITTLPEEDLGLTNGEPQPITLNENQEAGPVHAAIVQNLTADRFEEFDRAIRRTIGEGIITLPEEIGQMLNDANEANEQPTDLPF